MIRLALLSIGLLAASTAASKVEDATPTGFKVVHEITTAATPAAVWKALGRVGNWWDPEHTWSGDARNLRIDLRADGCFCERWKDQSVEHGHVIWAHRDQRLRLSGALGPLQEWGVSGLMEFVLEPGPEGTRIKFSYLVSGDARFKLDRVAGAVDQVMGIQVARLARYAATGSPVEAAVPD